jgi:hypothetical protein
MQPAYPSLRDEIDMLLRETQRNLSLHDLFSAQRPSPARAAPPPQSAFTASQSLGAVSAASPAHRAQLPHATSAGFSSTQQWAFSPAVARTPSHGLARGGPTAASAAAASMMGGRPLTSPSRRAPSSSRKPAPEDAGAASLGLGLGLGAGDEAELPPQPHSLDAAANGAQPRGGSSPSHATSSAFRAGIEALMERVARAEQGLQEHQRLLLAELRGRDAATAAALEQHKAATLSEAAQLVAALESQLLRELRDARGGLQQGEAALRRQLREEAAAAREEQHSRASQLSAAVAALESQLREHDASVRSLREGAAKQHSQLAARLDSLASAEALARVVALARLAGADAAAAAAAARGAEGRLEALSASLEHQERAWRDALAARETVWAQQREREAAAAAARVEGAERATAELRQQLAQAEARGREERAQLQRVLEQRVDDAAAAARAQLEALRGETDALLAAERVRRVAAPPVAADAPDERAQREAVSAAVAAAESRWAERLAAATHAWEERFLKQQQQLVELRTAIDGAVTASAEAATRMAELVEPALRAAPPQQPPAAAEDEEEEAEAEEGEKGARAQPAAVGDEAEKDVEAPLLALQRAYEERAAAQQRQIEAAVEQLRRLASEQEATRVAVARLEAAETDAEARGESDAEQLRAALASHVEEQAAMADLLRAQVDVLRRELQQTRDAASRPSSPPPQPQQQQQGGEAPRAEQRVAEARVEAELATLREASMTHRATLEQHAALITELQHAVQDAGVELDNIRAFLEQPQQEEPAAEDERALGDGSEAAEQAAPAALPQPTQPQPLPLPLPQPQPPAPLMTSAARPPSLEPAPSPARAAAAVAASPAASSQRTSPQAPLPAPAPAPALSPARASGPSPAGAATLAPPAPSPAQPQPPPQPQPQQQQQQPPAAAAAPAGAGARRDPFGVRSKLLPVADDEEGEGDEAKDGARSPSVASPVNASSVLDLSFSDEDSEAAPPRKRP